MEVGIVTDPDVALDELIEQESPTRHPDLT